MADLPVPAHMLERAVTRFERESRARIEPGSLRPPRVITISRELGAGGRAVAEILAKSLGWPLWDKEILDVMVSQSHLNYQTRMFDALDETTQSGIDAALYALVGGAHKDVYFYQLPRAILIIAQSDAILLGRGAHLLLPNALKLRITASIETRLKDVMQREGLAERDARARIRTSDRERSAFLKELAARLSYGRRRAEVQPEYDLVVNTDCFSHEQTASIVLKAAAYRFGLDQVARE